MHSAHWPANPVNAYSASYRGSDFPRTYADAQSRYNAWRDNPRRRTEDCRLAHNTTLERFETLDPSGVYVTAYSVRFHRTHVATFYQSGSVKLNTGGWQTATTRDRLNRAGVRIGMGGGIASVSHGGRDYAYRDGMTLEPDGSARYADGAPAVDAEPLERARRRNLARYRRALKRPAPPSGLFSPWIWPTRMGGYVPGGNAPEAFEGGA